MLEIEFAEGRPCISAWCARKYLGDVNKVLKNVDRSESGLRIGTELIQPEIGAEYRLTWMW